MKYETFTFEDPITSQLSEYITLYINENNAKTFPVDESNPDYIKFLEQLDSEPKV